MKCLQVCQTTNLSWNRTSQVIKSYNDIKMQNQSWSVDTQFTHFNQNTNKSKQYNHSPKLRLVSFVKQPISAGIDPVNGWPAESLLWQQNKTYKTKGKSIDTTNYFIASHNIITYDNPMTVCQW